MLVTSDSFLDDARRAKRSLSTECGMESCLLLQEQRKLFFQAIVQGCASQTHGPCMWGDTPVLLGFCGSLCCQRQLAVLAILTRFTHLFLNVITPESYDFKNNNLQYFGRKALRKCLIARFRLI